MDSVLHYQYDNDYTTFCILLSKEQSIQILQVLLAFTHCKTIACIVLELYQLLFSTLQQSNTTSPCLQIDQQDFWSGWLRKAT